MTPPRSRNTGHACTRATRSRSRRTTPCSRLGAVPRGPVPEGARRGLKAGGAGITVANKAQSIYANYLEKSEKTKLAMFMEVAERAEAQARSTRSSRTRTTGWPTRSGRYSQGISVAKALTQGLGGKVKTALETTIASRPSTPTRTSRSGAFHAEVIDKVGKLLGKTQGADTATGLKLFKEASRSIPTPRSRASSTPTGS
jgi:hypothetical protein